MPREAEPSINERDFLIEALRENIRLDGRALDAYRSISLTFSDDYGTAEVKIGNTRVLTHISASITQPLPDRKFDGIFTITAELSPMASPLFEPGRPTPLETLLNRHLEHTLRRTSALSTESLCLLASRRVWSLLATVHVLSHDGNLLDASCLCVLASLLHFRLPATSIQGEELTVYGYEERAPMPLSILHEPLCVSMAFFEGGGKVVWDAGLLEEATADGTMVVAANRQGEVCLISKMGGVPTDALVLLRCVEVAVGKVRDLSKVLHKALEEDAGRRDQGLGKELSASNER